GENVGDLIVGGKKLLHLPWRLEALHDPLSSSRWLVGILRPVVEMGWTTPIGINVPRCGSRRTCRKEATRHKYYDDRPRYRQVRVSGSRRKRGGQARDQAETAKERTDRVLRKAAGLHGRDGGLRRGPSLGAHADRSRTQREADRA